MPETKNATHDVSLLHSTSRAAISINIGIFSKFANKVFESRYPRLIEATYNLNLLLSIKDQQAAQATQHIISRLLKQTQTNLEQEHDQLKRLIQDNGTPLTRYASKARYNHRAEVFSPDAMAFIKLLNKMDSLICLMEAANFAGLVDEKEYISAGYSWQKRLLAVTGTSIYEIDKASKAAASRKKSSFNILHRAI